MESSARQDASSSPFSVQVPSLNINIPIIEAQSKALQDAPNQGPRPYLQRLKTDGLHPSPLSMHSLPNPENPELSALETSFQLYTPSDFPSAAQAEVCSPVCFSDTPMQQRSPLRGPLISISRRKPSERTRLEQIVLPNFPPGLVSFESSGPSSPSLSDDNAESEDEIDSENAWNLIPYDIAWGSSYYGYRKSDCTLPGPDGKCVFLRSPTPLKFQRTGQACEKCRERKAKCSGARPSCARCTTRGLHCEYASEPKRADSEDPLGSEDADSVTDGDPRSSTAGSRRRNSPTSAPRIRSNTELNARDRLGRAATVGKALKRRHSTIGLPVPFPVPQPSRSFRRRFPSTSTRSGQLPGYRQDLYSAFPRANVEQRGFMHSEAPWGQPSHISSSSVSATQETPSFVLPYNVEVSSPGESRLQGQQHQRIWNEWSSVPVPSSMNYAAAASVSRGEGEPQVMHDSDASCALPTSLGIDQIECTRRLELENVLAGDDESAMQGMMLVGVGSDSHHGPGYLHAVPECASVDGGLPMPLSSHSHSLSSSSTMMAYGHAQDTADLEFASSSDDSGFWLRKDLHFGSEPALCTLPQVNVDMHSPDFFHFDHHEEMMSALLTMDRAATPL